MGTLTIDINDLNENTLYDRITNNISNIEFLAEYEDHDFITNEDAKIIGELLKEKSSVTSADFAVIDINDDAVKIIAKTLEDKKCNLKFINFSHCYKIGDEGAKSIANALKHNNCKLEYLNLKSNNIGNNGAKSIANAIGINSTLTFLNISMNDKIGNEGYNELKESLKKNTSIIQFYPRYNENDKLFDKKRPENYDFISPYDHSLSNVLKKIKTK